MKHKLPNVRFCHDSSPMKIGTLKGCIKSCAAYFLYLAETGRIPEMS